MGPSGSGKTTLLLMLGALLKPTAGDIQLNGEIISALAENRLPEIRLRKFGFIFQDFNLLSALTVLDNVAVVAQLTGLKRREAKSKARDILNELDLEDRLHFLPEKLSGGEKQRSPSPERWSMILRSSWRMNRPRIWIRGSGKRSCACSAVSPKSRDAASSL